MTDRLTQLFAVVFDLEVDQLNDESNPDTVEKWDSLAAMQLVAEIEETFNVQLKTTEIMMMDSIGRARQVLKRKGVEGI